MQDYDNTTTVLTLWRTNAPWGWHLTKVTVGNSVTSIGSYAFVGDQHLEVIALYPCVTSIGQGAFDRCDAALQISLPSNVTTIGSGAFANCKGLERVDFDCNETVTLGGSDVFTGCDALQYIVFPTLDAVLANTTGNWSGYSDKLHTQFGGKLFSATNEGGTPAYKIATEEDLRNLASAVNSSFSNSGSGLTFRQTADIAMSSTDFTPIGNSSFFRGIYDGGYHVISGLTVNTSGYAGLFGYVYGGTVKDLALVNPSVTGGGHTGAIVGRSLSSNTCHSIFTNLYTHGTNLNVIGQNENSSYSTVTNVAHTSAITLGTASPPPFSPPSRPTALSIMA